MMVVRGCVCFRKGNNGRLKLTGSIDEGTERNGARECAARVYE